MRPISRSRNVVRMLAATLVPEHCSSGHCGKFCRWSHLISSASGQRNCWPIFKAVSCYPICQVSAVSRACPHTIFVGTRSTCAISLCCIEVVWPSSQSMVTPLQDVPTTVPRSVTLLSQQTRSPIPRVLDCSPVILILPTHGYANTLAVL
jgi:hypothetical protein